MEMHMAECSGRVCVRECGISADPFQIEARADPTDEREKQKKRETSMETSAGIHVMCARSRGPPIPNSV